MKTYNIKKLCALLFLSLTLPIIGQVTNFKSIEGVWESDGYGRVVDIQKKKATIYDICSINCNNVVTVGNKRFFNAYKIFKTSDSTFVAKEGVSKYHFRKIEKLPVLCLNKSDRRKDPLHNFEVLWQTFEENYCYFEERKIDWDKLKTKYKSQITKDIKPFDFFLLLDNLVNELDDGHSNMYVPDKLVKAYQEFKLKKRAETVQKTKDSLGQGFDRYPIKTKEVRTKIFNNYVEKPKTFNFGLINYGLINQDVALVQINGMERYANYNIPNDISESKAQVLYEKNAAKSKNYPKDNVIGASYIIDKIIAEIRKTKACVIDIRFNGGGYDTVQLEILKRFATKDTIAVYKKARNGSGFSQKQHFRVTPTKNAYKGKVFILTSYQTASAAEDFTLCAMAAIPNAVRIGSNTEGIFSDLLTKKLPNGWEYSLSNEIYQSPDGKSYEAIGIPPHHKIEYDKRMYWFYRHLYDNATSKDLAIEKALSLMNKI